MKKYILALLVVAFATTGAVAYGPLCRGECMVNKTTSFQERWPDKSMPMIQLTQDKTTTVQTTAPVSSTTVVKGGNLAAQIIEWLQVAFGTTIGAAILWAFTKGLSYIGIKITSEQRSQLQAIVVNGLNAAAARAEVQLRDNPNLDINIKSKIIGDAVRYTQDHGAETIKALGMDPKSGEAVEAINARIQTALNDPNTPTPQSITPTVTQPLAPAA